jgi:hypothetical protein
MTVLGPILICLLITYHFETSSLFCTNEDMFFFPSFFLSFFFVRCKDWTKGRLRTSPNISHFFYPSYSFQQYRYIMIATVFVQKQCFPLIPFNLHDALSSYSIILVLDFLTNILTYRSKAYFLSFVVCW